MCVGMIQLQSWQISVYDSDPSLSMILNKTNYVKYVAIDKHRVITSNNSLSLLNEIKIKTQVTKG